LKAGDKSGEKKNQSQKKPALAGVGGIGKRSEAVDSPSSAECNLSIFCLAW